MKTKITLLIISCQKNVSPEDATFANIFLDENLKPPSRYISTKSASETIRDMCSYYLNIHPRWLTFEISDFRKCSISECEVVYTCYLPVITDACISGKFHSHLNVPNLDTYYARILSRQRFTI